MSEPEVTHLGLPTDWDAVAERFSLKAECEAQHTRAERAEAELQRLRDDNEALKRRLQRMGQSTDRDELIDELQRLRDGLATLEQEWLSWDSRCVIPYTHDGCSSKADRCDFCEAVVQARQECAKELQSLLTQTHGTCDCPCHKAHTPEISK